MTELALRTWPYFGPQAPSTQPEVSEVADVTGTIPRRVRVRADETAVQSWVDVAVVSMEGIAKIGDDEFGRVAFELPKFVNSDATAFRRSSRLKKLSNGAYVETNLSAATIYRLCAQAAQLAGLGPEEWNVAYDVASAEDGDEDEQGDAPSSLSQLQRDFWSNVHGELASTGQFKSLRSPRAQPWFAIALGKTGVHMSLSANAHASTIAVKVVIMPDRAQEYLEKLVADKAAIESEIGTSLVWNPHPEKRVKTIKLSHPANIQMREAWPAAVEWLVQTAISVRTAFAPRVARIDVVVLD